MPYFVLSEGVLLPYFVLWSDTAHDHMSLRFSRGQRVRYVFRGDLLEPGVKVYLDAETQSSSDELTHKVL